jgi:23S rRNA pseudouridine1911/1915/1917 synthase
MTDSEQIVFSAGPKDIGERLDRILVTRLGDRLTRSQLQALIKDGHATVNGAAVKTGFKLKGGEQIALTIPPPPVADSVAPEPIALDIVYEDDELAVINKPAGLVVHPGAGNLSGTLVNAILARYPEISEMRYAPQRRGIVHRLDKDTSGLILIAKREPAMRHLSNQFQQRTVEKVYLALVEKPPKTPIGRIDLPIARDPNHRTRMSVQRDGRPAVSEFTVIEHFNSGPALLEVKLLTGRTHQIRVHLAYLGSPIIGDAIYGYRKQKLRGQFLHAARLCFDHPSTGERLCFEAPLPERLQTLLDELRGS